MAQDGLSILRLRKRKREQAGGNIDALARATKVSDGVLFLIYRPRTTSIGLSLLPNIIRGFSFPRGYPAKTFIAHRSGSGWPVFLAPVVTRGYTDRGNRDERKRGRENARKQKQWTGARNGSGSFYPVREKFISGSRRAREPRRISRRAARPVRNVLHWPVKCRDCRSRERASTAEG